MKRLICLALSFIVCVLATAQGVQYSVLGTSNKVTYQETISSKPERIKPGIHLRSSCLLNLNQGQEVIVINDNTGAYYPYTAKDTEQISLARIIKKSSQSSVRSFLEQLFSSSSKNNTIINQRAGIDRADDNHPSIACRIINDLSGNSYKRVPIDNRLILKKHFVAKNGVFYPELINHTGDSLFVNILCIDSSKDVIDLALSFSDGETELLMRIPPFDSISLPSFLFQEKRELHFFVFGTDISFTPSLLKMELLSRAHSYSQKDSFSIVYGNTVK